jgi:hypothetical protein
MTLINMDHYHSNMFILARLYYRGEPLYCDEDCTEDCIMMASPGAILSEVR